MSILQIIKSHQLEIIKAEIGAFLHDIGKLGSDFIGGNYSLHEVIGGTVANLSFSSSWPNDLKKRYNCATSSQVQKYFSPQFKGILAKTCSYSPPFDDRQYSWGDFIDLHTQGIYSNIRYFLGSTAKLTEVLAKCDGYDSGSDKGDAQDKQSGQIYFSTAFGDEKPISFNLDNIRKELASILEHEISNLPNNRPKLLEKIKDSYLQALGETRRAANDVTLWDHSYSVASLYKSAIAQIFIEKNLADANPVDSRWRILDTNGSLNLANLRWRILGINFDILNILGKAHKVADALAYISTINEVFKKLKDLLEVEYPFGNEIYRDTTGIYFNFPNIDISEELKTRLYQSVIEVEPELTPVISVNQPEPEYENTSEPGKEELKGLLGKRIKAVRAEINTPIRQENLFDWQKEWNQAYTSEPATKWEVCPVCHLRSKREKDEVCECCKKRRKSRVVFWKGNPSSTIWIDEVSDHNGRVALLGGRFDLTHWLDGNLVKTMLVNLVKSTPKNPSPARLRRIWETCLNFWSKGVQNILEDTSYGKHKDIRTKRLIIIPKWQTNSSSVLEEKIYDGEIEGNPISLFWLPENQYFITAINLELLLGDSDIQWLKGKEVKLKDVNMEISFSISDILEIGEWSSYLPFISLIEYPDQFMALVPARDALTLVENIQNKFEKHFSKVHNRLPLFLGLIFFPRKTPLYAVMDAGKRMLNSQLNWEEWIVKEDVTGGNVEFENGIRWKVIDTLGDGTPDNYYPMFYIKEPSIPGHFLKHICPGNGHELPLFRVNELKKGNITILTPSRFSYIFLDTTTRRFEAGREISILYLEDFSRLNNLWNKLKGFCADGRLSDTKLKVIEALLGTKKDKWGADSEAYKNLVRDTLKVELELQGDELIEMEESVFSGVFFRCLELNPKILKKKLRKEE